jgi:hypothetical protein
MTNEKRTLIAPQDILSLGFECPHCGSTYFSPVDKIDRVLRGCPNCQESFVTDAPVAGSDYSDMRLLEFFVRFLRQVRNRPFGASFRFEIASEEKPES